MIKEIEDAVNSIEQDIFETTNCEYLNITVRSNGFVQIIDFIGIQLWNSEDDMREEVNDLGDKESIEVHLRRKVNEEITKLSAIIV